MFSVTWHHDAAEELLELFFATDPNDRAEWNAAVHAIEHALSRDPEETGESRDDPYRIAFLGRFAILFAVYPDAQKVVIRNVWKT